MVKNRNHWTIESIHVDRSVTLTGRTGTVRAPAGYAAEHVELGYAQTSHATQGRTVDTGLLLVDTPTDSRGVYTPMTRGRNTNHAYVVTDENRTAVDVLTQAIGRIGSTSPPSPGARSSRSGTRIRHGGDHCKPTDPAGTTRPLNPGRDENPSMQTVPMVIAAPKTSTSTVSSNSNSKRSKSAAAPAGTSTAAASASVADQPSHMLPDNGVVAHSAGSRTLVGARDRSWW